MCWKWFLFCLNLLIVRGDSANQNPQTASVESAPKSENNAKTSRMFFYTNADTFYKNRLDSKLYYKPLDKVQINEPFYGDSAVYRLYELKSGLTGFPYMIPISNEIVNQVIDPIYQNKLHGSSPSENRDTSLSGFCKGRRGQFPSPRSCSYYFNCWDGGVVAEQECPGGLLFSSSGYCDYPHHVACGQRPITSKMAACNDEFSAYRDPDNCGGFFVCVSGQPVQFKCPADLHYSERLGVCDYPHRVQCNVSLGGSVSLPSPPPPPPMTSSPPSPAAASPADDASAAGPVWSTPYMAVSQQDALRQIEQARMRLPTQGVPYFSHF